MKVFNTIYGHGGNLGHVTWTIHIKFLSPLPRRCHLKFGEKMFENNGHIHVYSPGAGADIFFHKPNTLGQTYKCAVQIMKPFLYIILGHPKPKKMHIFRFVGIFEYIILLMLILFLDMCQNS